MNTDNTKKRIRMFGCNNSEQQKWEKTPSGALKHRSTGLCLIPAMVKTKQVFERFQHLKRRDDCLVVI